VHISQIAVLSRKSWAKIMGCPWEEVAEKGAPCFPGMGPHNSHPFNHGRDSIEFEEYYMDSLVKYIPSARRCMSLFFSPLESERGVSLC
jgi:hypothetical protein